MIINIILCSVVVVYCGILSFIKFCKPQKKVISSEVVPVEILKHNVGLVNIVASYLDENNKVSKIETQMYGVCHAKSVLDYEDTFKYIKKNTIISARDRLDRWLKGAQIFGVYDFEDHILIPRERMLKIVITYSDYWVKE